MQFGRFRRHADGRLTGGQLHWRDDLHHELHDQGANRGTFDNTGALDMQLIEPSRQMWKALLNDPQVQSGTITVKGPVTTVGGKNETGSYYTLTGDRDAASQIN